MSTLMFYLNDVQQGGYTAFPRLGVAVRSDRKIIPSRMLRNVSVSPPGRRRARRCCGTTCTRTAGATWRCCTAAAPCCAAASSWLTSGSGRWPTSSTGPASASPASTPSSSSVITQILCNVAMLQNVYEKIDKYTMREPKTKIIFSRNNVHFLP